MNVRGGKGAKVVKWESVDHHYIHCYRTISFSFRHSSPSWNPICIRHFRIFTGIFRQQLHNGVREANMEEIQLVRRTVHKRNTDW